MTLAAGAKPTVFLRDYRAPAWRITDAELEFELDAASTFVVAKLTVEQAVAQADAPLTLDGEGLELIELRVDGRLLSTDAFALDARSLTIPGARSRAVVETRTRIAPDCNTALQGLYLSGRGDTGFLLTQCEAEGFRRITWFIDRPDVLARYTVTLRADKKRFPLLLANGNAVGSGDLADGRHWARFVDPHPKPSYLFALVAGKLARIEDEFVTAEGRHVRLFIHAEADLIERCAWAMQCVKMAMRWDEERFGRCYDLDVFHVVATRDFTMGAMENKGLNIFNAKYLVADPEHATDDDYRHVLAVVGHEYFHNWSGNRVTCRDWFQLSLKEGLTVYREQEFESDLASRTLRRIEDVRTLWRAQFSEDAGPLAHPVRPDRYSEINNFYTATVYDKGAEIVRMLAVLLGTDGFRKGLDLYFERHDGGAATVEDFLAALGQANGRDLSAWLGWYNQAGTPLLSVRGRFDANSHRYEITLSQRTPPTPNQPHKRALPLPVAVQLFGGDGAALPLRLDGEDDAATDERILSLDGDEATFRFVGVVETPAVSLLRGYSAPVRLDQSVDNDALARLVRHDTDGFNRWFAADALARRLFANTLAAAAPDEALLALWSDEHRRGAWRSPCGSCAGRRDPDRRRRAIADIGPCGHRSRSRASRAHADRKRARARAARGALRTLCESRRWRGRCLTRRAGETATAQCLPCGTVPRRFEASRARSRAIRRSPQPDGSARGAQRAGQRRRHGRASRSRRIRVALRRRHDGAGQVVLGAGDARASGHAVARAGADFPFRVPLEHAEFGVCIAGCVRASQSARVPSCGRCGVSIRGRLRGAVGCDQSAGRGAARHRVRPVAELRADPARADAA